MQVEDILNTVIQGDSLEIMKQLPDKCIDLIVTSPPYNKGKRKVGNNQTWYAYDIDYDSYSDDLPEEEYNLWQKEIMTECFRLLKEGGSIFYNHKPIYRDGLVRLPLNLVNDFPLRQVIIWDRGSSPDLNVNKFYPTTEWILWFSKGKPKFNGGEFANYKEVWRMNYENNNTHPAPFPVELPMRCILSTTSEKDIVLDTFMGSGTTALACKQTNRNFIGIDISQKYCDIANERLKQDLLF